MSETIRFSVPGVPRGRHDPQPFVAGGHARLTTHSKDKHPRAVIVTTFKQKFPDHKVWTGPVVIYATAWFPLTKNRTNAKWKVQFYRDNLAPHVVKPDSDNISKLLKDALKNVAWRDDCQVFSDHTLKYYCHTEDEMPRLEVTISHRPELVPASPKKKKEKPDG